jgi:hypothetical protein
VTAWFEALSPDFSATFRRFPFSIIFALCGAILLVLGSNSVGILGEEVWRRATIGLMTGAAFGVGGVLFAESRPDMKRLGPVMKYLVPLLIAASFEIMRPDLYFPFAMPLVGVLWASVAAFTQIGKGAEREAAQNRFWWLNHQAIATGGIAAAAFLIIFIGLGAIERSLATLFGLSIGDAFYRWVLPFTGFFLAPVYWLSTIPKLSDYDARQLETPEFISKAIGFLGQFLLAPLLLVYGLILLAYTVQIVIVGQLPEGTLGWMVLGFVTVGAGTWLVLHPPFLRDRLLVKVFRRSWFWLTLVPLALFAYAVWVRVDAYGVTPERMMLIGGGLWAVLLSAIFLTGKGDIRIIPALAGAIIVLMSIGPWNIENAPRESQAMRLAAIMDRVGLTSVSASPAWTMETEREARDIVYYLVNNGGTGQLESVLAEQGVPVTTSGEFGVSTALASLKLPESDVSNPSYQGILRDRSLQIDIAATPYMVGPFTLYMSGRPVVGGVQLGLEEGQIWLSDDAPDFATGTLTDVSAWVASEQAETLSDPVIDILHNGVTYRLVLQGGSIETPAGASPGERFLSYVDGVLFRSAPVPGVP